MNSPVWRPLPTKVQFYEALYSLNRGFEAALLSMKRLERWSGWNAWVIPRSHKPRL